MCIAAPSRHIGEYAPTPVPSSPAASVMMVATPGSSRAGKELFGARGDAMPRSSAARHHCIASWKAACVFELPCKWRSGGGLYRFRTGFRVPLASR
eukprot:5678644-Prymnesium_polylepis.1